MASTAENVKAINARLGLSITGVSPENLESILVAVCAALPAKPEEKSTETIG